MTTLLLMNSLSRLFCRRSFLLAAIALVSFAALATAQAQLSPPPDGGYFRNNTAEGTDALYHLSPVQLTGGFQNTAIGWQALYSNTSGRNNAAIGDQALWGNITGDYNTANGSQALLNNTTGSQNTANGYRALFNNLSGTNNTATGYWALLNNNGDSNTADGFEALLSNKGGKHNTAVGWQALKDNTNGIQNTAIGYGALAANSIGSSNTADGYFALVSNASGNKNTANGYQALEKARGSLNIAVGYRAGGNLAGGDNNIYIGNDGPAVLGSESGRIRIGTVGVHNNATYVAGIHLVPITTNNPLPVVVDSAGHLGTTATSSRRFKKEIQPMAQTSEVILALKPVTFHYKSDSDGTPQFGLIAEEVAQVNPDLVVRDENGEVYTVRYDAVNAMLLNEFLKQHRKVEELEATLARQETEMKVLAAGLREQQSQIARIGASLESTKPPLTVTKR